MRPYIERDYLYGVRQKYALRCSELTAPLMRESVRLLKSGEFTWQRDDTHRNRHGIAVAARMIATDIGTSTGKEKQYREVRRCLYRETAHF